MPFLDSILPPTLDPFVRNIINVLVGVHILAFLVWVYLVTRSVNKTQTQEFREQYQKLEQKIASEKKSRLNKQE